MSVDDLPTQPDDPRLDDWYHTIELGNGLVSRGLHDHRSVVDAFGFPDSLRGKTCLDVATANGFFAFEMERRGADRVVAIDAPRLGDLDWLPPIRTKMGSRLDEALGPGQAQFQMAHALRRSSVEWKFCNVYDLSPETVGMFDVVFCGSLLLHLHNPFKALLSIRSVTREMAIVETLVDPELDERFPAKPLLSFGSRTSEAELGSAMVYWRFSTRALEDMLAYAGFAETRRQKPFGLPPGGAGLKAGLTQPTPVTAIVGYPTSRRAERPHDKHTRDRATIGVLSAGLSIVGDRQTTMKPGARYSFQLEVTNLGDTVWSATPNGDGGFVQLGAHLSSDNGRVINYDYGRGRLVADVSPGQTQTVDLSLEAPREPGLYEVVFDMVCERVSWFAPRGSQTLGARIEVLSESKNPDAHGRRR